MGNAVQGRDLGAKLVRAVGLPTHDCLGAQLVTPASGSDELVVRYKLTHEALAKLAAAQSGQGVAAALVGGYQPRAGVQTPPLGAD